MAGEAGASIVIIIFAILAIFYQINLESNRKKAIISYFTERGFSHPNMKELRFIDSDHTIAYEVEKFSRGAGKNRRSYYRLHAIAEYDRTIKFNITERGALSKIFGSNKGVFNSLHEDFNIVTTNPYQVQFFFSGLTFEKLENLFRYRAIRSIDVNGQGGLLVVEIELDRQNRPLFKSIEFLEEIMPKLLSNDIFEGEEFEDYICFNCKEEISFFGDFCLNCGIVAPKCVICFDDPEPDERVILFDCCKSYAHESHALMWTEREEFCPSCRRKQPKLIPIKELDDT